MGTDERYVFGIASYKRADRQPMLQMLAGYGYTRDEIILSTQTEEDYAEYTRLYSDKATVIYRKGHNVSDNKNTLLDYAVNKLGNRQIVLCSDKVRGVQFLGRDRKLHMVETREMFEAIVSRAFAITKKLGGSAWGCYTTANAFYMKHTISTNMQLLGCFMGIVDPSLQQFDTNQPLKEDFEFVLRHVMHRRCTVRFNDICLRATLHTQGGCFDSWSNTEMQRRCNERILRRYAGLVVKHPTRQNEQKYIGTTKTYNYSILAGLI